MVNTRLHGYEVDFLWMGARLEIDSFTYHRSWAQIQRDQRRDADLKVRGFDVLRFSPERLPTDEDGAFAQVSMLLER